MVSRWSDNSWLVGGQIIVGWSVGSRWSDNSWLVGGQIIVG